MKPGRAEIKKFLDGAVIDPNKKGNFLERQIVENGEPSYFEMRVMEHMAEARRLRERMVNDQTLSEEYWLIMQKAATMLAVSACKICT